MKSKVIILLSDKRSGSTIFEEELCKHPDINHVVYTPHSYNETHYWLMAACMLGSPEQLFHGHRRHRSYGSSQQARRLLIDCIRGMFRISKYLKTTINLCLKAGKLCADNLHTLFFLKNHRSTRTIGPPWT